MGGKEPNTNGRPGHQVLVSPRIGKDRCDTNLGDWSRRRNRPNVVKSRPCIRISELVAVQPGSNENMRKVERVIASITWTLSCALILFVIENVWLEPFVRSHVRRRVPSLIPESGSSIWTVVFGAIGISCALLLVCLIFLIKTEGFKSIWTFGAAAIVGASIALSVVWFRATGMEEAKAHSVTLKWNASTSSDVLGYNVYRKALPNGAEKKLNGYLVRELNYEDQDVQSGVRYRYTVKAFNGYESAECTPVEVVAP